jgi:hypothetical protein
MVNGFAAANAAEPIWYDSAKQAIAVDPYYDGFGGKIEIDFNADHSWAGIITQSGWHYLYGDVTSSGLYQYTFTQYPGGGSSQGWVYGWGTSLGSLNPAINYDSYVTKLYYGLEAADKFRYFTDDWDVARGKTTIYVQPATISNTGITLTKADLSNVYFKTNWGPWKKFTDVYEVEPDPINAGIIINPKTLNRKSKGNWITSYIELPAGYSIYDVDTASIGLTVHQEKQTNGIPVEEVLYTAGPMEIGDDDTNSVPDLMVKFDRQDLIQLLVTGDATLTIKGKLKDGTPFVGSNVIRVIN